MFHRAQLMYSNKDRLIRSGQLQLRLNDEKQGQSLLNCKPDLLSSCAGSHEGNPPKHRIELVSSYGCHRWSAVSDSIRKSNVELGLLMNPLRDDEMLP